jgi:hypothetical protein
MKQVFRKGLSHIVVAEAPEPLVVPHHVLVNPVFSLISSGTESASIHEGIIKEVAENPSQLRKIWDGVKAMGPLATITEVRAKFQEYATLGYAGAGIISQRHPTVTQFKVGDRVAYGGEGTGHGETILASQNLIVRVPDEVPTRSGFRKSASAMSSRLSVWVWSDSWSRSWRAFKVRE